MAGARSAICFRWSAAFGRGILEVMASNILTTPTDLTVDLTGLPEPVVRGIRQLVQALKGEHTGEGTGPATSGGGREPPAERFAPLFISRPNPSPEELEGLLDEFSSVSTGKVLPPDFSRADIYDDHV
jgi:hypothetical protein